MNIGKILKKIISLLMIVLFLLSIFSGCKNNNISHDYDWIENGDMDVIKNRMLEDLYDLQADPSECLLNLQEDGSFGNIDYYTDKKDTWHPAKHLDCILTMQIAANTPGNAYYQNEELLSGISKAIKFWVDNNFYCEWNGWWNNLGTGPKIADILLLCDESTDEQVVDKLLDNLYSSTCLDDTKKYNVKEREINSTGGNLTDSVNFSLKYAVLKNDGESIMFLKNLMENELRPFPSKKLFSHRWDVEGIKADMSFQQHFEMLYFGGYGEVFATGMNRFVKYTSGTQFAISNNALNFYQDFLLDGLQYAMRGEYRDINASGRGIVREDSLRGIYDQVETGCRILLNSGAELTRSKELEELLANRTANSDIGAGGHKYFWCSDYQVYNDTAYMATVRAASKRTKNSEALNGENVWGHYLGAGATMYYVNGDEYYNIPPLWNWNRIPGTTAVQGVLPYGTDKTYTRMGKTKFVGGVSTGDIGMSCLDYRDNGVKAKKAWFMFEEGVYCLGTDISSHKKGEVYTCINQTLLRENIEYSIKGNVYSAEEINKEDTFDWVYNNKIGYITSAPLSVSAGMRTGDWKTVSERLDSKTHSDTVLELGILHGEKPKSESYSYFVLMNTTAADTKKFAENPIIQPLSNDKNCQAAWNDESKILMAVFWKKGEIKLPTGEILSVSRDCSLVCTETDEKYDVYISNPKQNGGKVTICIGSNEKVVSFSKDMYAGQTRHICIDRDGLK